MSHCPPDSHVESAPGLKHLVLLGAGHGHVDVLHSLAQHRLADPAIVAMAPYPRQLCWNAVLSPDTRPLLSSIGC